MSHPYKAVISKYGKWHSQRQAIRLWLTRSEPYCFLLDLNTALAAKGKYTDAVDDLLVKLTIARRKKLKISYI